MLPHSFIPRPAYHVFPLELPPLSAKERKLAALSRLRGLYPAKPDDKQLVLLPNGRRGFYLALLFDPSLKNEPLSIPTLAAIKLCKREAEFFGRKLCFITLDGWIECLVIEDGSLLSSTVSLREVSL